MRSSHGVNRGAVLIVSGVFAATVVIGCGSGDEHQTSEPVAQHGAAQGTHEVASDAPEQPRAAADTAAPNRSVSAGKQEAVAVAGQIAPIGASAVLKQSQSHAPQANAEDEAASRSTGLRGLHQVNGLVSHLNHKNGMMSVRAGAHQLELHFPPSLLEDVKEGDKVLVELAFEPLLKAEQPPQTVQQQHAFDAPEFPGMQGLHTVRATIARIDHDTGKVEVNTVKGALTLYFPKHSVDDLNDGDRISVDLAFAKVANM